MKVIISGFAGRMGTAVAECISKHEDMSVACGVDIANSPSAKCPIFENINDFTGEADVIIDFSHHSLTKTLADYAVKRGLPLVASTTGRTAEEDAILLTASKKTAIFASANMSVGVALLKALVQKAAAVLPCADIEIIEKHHNNKIDAPSGTALILGNAVRDVRSGMEFVYDRHTKREKRAQNEIGMHSVRGGGIVGEHDVIFASDNEVLTISHSALSRSLFAEGAVRAAAFLEGKPAGMYQMDDLVASIL